MIEEKITHESLKRLNLSECFKNNESDYFILNILSSLNLPKLEALIFDKNFLKS